MFIYLLPLGAHADDSGLSAKDIKTLFFGHDDQSGATARGESVGRDWPVGNRQRQSVYGDADLSASGADRGPLLLRPRAEAGQSGRPALHFRRDWVYEITASTARSQLRQTPKADGDGWIVPSAAAPSDFGLIVPLRSVWHYAIPALSGQQGRFTAAPRRRAESCQSGAPRSSIILTATAIAS